MKGTLMVIATGGGGQYESMANYIKKHQDDYHKRILNIMESTGKNYREVYQEILTNFIPDKSQIK